MRTKLGRHRGDTGAAALEFALVVPLLVMLVFGIIQFGIVFAQQLGLSNGARQGARLGVVNKTMCGDIVNEVQNAATTLGLNTSAVQVQVQVQTGAAAATTSCAYTSSTATTGAGATQPCLNSADDTRLIVTAKYSSSLIIPFASNLTSIGITGKGVYRCEYTV